MYCMLKKYFVFRFYFPFFPCGWLSLFFLLMPNPPVELFFHFENPEISALQNLKICPKVHLFDISISYICQLVTAVFDALLATLSQSTSSWESDYNPKLIPARFQQRITNLKPLVPFLCYHSDSEFRAAKPKIPATRRNCVNITDSFNLFSQ